MRVHNAPPNSKFTLIDNNCLRDISLSNKSKGLLCTMLSMSECWQFSVKGLAAICKDGEDAIRAQLQELEKCGYLVRKQLRDKSGRLVQSEYYLYDVPQQETPGNDGQDTVPSPDMPVDCSMDAENSAEDQPPEPQEREADRREQQADPNADCPEPESKEKDLHRQIPEMEMPAKEKPVQEKPLRENPATEDPTQRNTKESNTKERKTNQRKINQSYPSSFPLNRSSPA